MFLSDFWGFSRMSFMTLACLLVRRLLWMEFEVFECSFLVSSIIILFFKSVGSWWDGLISKVLLYEHEDLSSNHWHPCKNRAQHTYNLSAEVERRGNPRPCLPASVEARGLFRMSSCLLSTPGFETRSFTDLLDWLASGLQWSSCLCLPSTRVTGTNPYPYVGASALFLYSLGQT